MSKRRKTTRQKREANRRARGGLPAPPELVPIPCSFEHAYGNALLAGMGPLVNGGWAVHPITASALIGTSKEIPKPYDGALILDTGATSTCISLKAAKALGLNPIRYAHGLGSGGKTRNPVFLATLLISIADEKGRSMLLQFPFEAQGIPDLDRASAELKVSFAGSPIEVIGLLGRDVLRFTRFVYDGMRGTLTLSFNLQAMGIETHTTADRPQVVAMPNV